jgi:hypothetical protein
MTPAISRAEAADRFRASRTSRAGSVESDTVLNLPPAMPISWTAQYGYYLSS